MVVLDAGSKDPGDALPKDPLGQAPLSSVTEPRDRSLKTYVERGSAPSPGSAVTDVKGHMWFLNSR